MGYVYAGLWFLVGLILIFALGKENKVFYLAGGFFLLLGGWWLADVLLPEKQMFAGGWGWAFRGIAAAALIVLLAVFLKERRKTMEDKPGEKPKDRGDR